MVRVRVHHWPSCRVRVRVRVRVVCPSCASRHIPHLLIRIDLVVSEPIALLSLEAILNDAFVTHDVWSCCASETVVDRFDGRCKFACYMWEKHTTDTGENRNG